MIKFKWETEFKQTEIGEVPREWEVISISDSSFAIIMGQSPPSKYYNKEGKGTLFIQGRKDFGDLYITPTTYTEKCSKTAPPNSALLTVRAPVGDVNITKDEVCIGRGLAVIYNVNGNPTSNRFIYYVLVGLKDYIASLGERGTTYEEIIKEDLENLLVPHPSPTEQSRIATVLSWFDDLIENKKRQNEILEKVAMAIFKSWFVDFEPFEDDEFVDSEFGRVPKGWKVKPIGEVAEFVKGLSYRSNELVDNLTEGEIFITLKIFKRGGGFRPEYKYYRGNRYSDEQVVYDGDLVIALTDMTSDAKVVGAPALVILPPYKDKGILSLDAAKLNVPQYMKEYAYLYLKDSQEENSTFANGVNVLHLNLNLFKIGKLILIPPQPILQHFHSLVEPLFQKIILNQKQIMVLRKIRDALLPKLIFGKLRVEVI